MLLFQSTDTFDECATKSQSVHDAIKSPVPLNYNNNHVETLPVHTYATHKLPNIIEMLSNRKKSKALVSYTSQAVPIRVVNHKETSQIEMDSCIKRIEPNESVEMELRVNDQHPDESVISATSETQKNGTNHLIMNNETMINHFGDKNPNCNLKGESNDIMNMDIIFENVPIEEDTSVIVETQPMTHSPIIDGVQYEIITLNKVQTPIIDDETNVIDMDEISAVTATATVTVTARETTTKMAIGTVSNNRSNEKDRLNGDFEIKHPTDDSNAKHYSQSIIVDYKKFELPIEQLNRKIPCERISTKKEGEETVKETKEEGSQEVTDAQKPVANCILDRKRKRKLVPVFNKRPRRTNLIKPPELKVQNENADAEAEPLKIEQAEEPVSTEKHIRNESPAMVSNENGNSASIEQNDEGIVVAKACEKNKNTQTDADQPNEPKSCKSADQGEDVGDENSFMNSLVVVESQDPNDLSKTLYEVFVVDPVTKEMSEKPLDLPDDVIQRICMSM